MSKIYSATYSNVPVYEFNISGNHVMRRRSDDWINATHILKVADFDKPARTRILEREVQKGTHEKVQGGYGKYQGTWVPLLEGRILAERNGVLDKLLPIFEYSPGDRSPPPAPKHATAASSRPKAPRLSANATAGASARRSNAPKATVGSLQPGHVVLRSNYSSPAVNHAPSSQVADDDFPYDCFDEQQYPVESQTPDHISRRSEDSDEDMVQSSQYSQQSTGRKRKRDVVAEPQQQIMSYEEQQHLLWQDELLDYFVLQSSTEPIAEPPLPPPTIDLNRPIDDKGHTPMHWAAAMGDMTVVKELLPRGAHIDTSSHNGESPLMRAVIFTNNFDKQTMTRLVDILISTVPQKDWFGSTVLHHIAVTTMSKSKYPCARYYLECILTKLPENWAPQQISHILDQQDHNGDTAVLLAARYGARKCVRLLISHGANIELPNHKGMTADRLIKELNARRRDRFQRPGSSSPVHNIQTSGLPVSLADAKDQNHNVSTTEQPLYRCEAASLLSSQLPVLIQSRADALAASLEAELDQCETEARDATRLLEQRRNDLEAVRARFLSVEMKDEDDEAENAQVMELDSLVEQSKILFEARQALDVKRMIGEAPAENASTGRSFLNEKLALAHALVEQQNQNRVLAEEFVVASSLAGSEERHNSYKKLITKALGVRTEDVESVLPDMLHELEEAKNDSVDIQDTKRNPIQARIANLHQGSAIGLSNAQLVA